MSPWVDRCARWGEPVGPLAEQPLRRRMQVLASSELSSAGASSSWARSRAYLVPRATRRSSGGPTGKLCSRTLAVDRATRRLAKALAR